MKKSIIIWIIAIVITLSAAVYQRLTGPTHPFNASISLDGTVYSFELLRSSGEESDAEIHIPIDDSEVTGVLHFRRYPTDEEWQKREMKRDGEELIAYLPQQPPAGKLEYYLSFQKGTSTAVVGEEKPVIIRFKGAVPSYVLLPHVILMFGAMLISNLAGILAIVKDRRFRFYTFIAFGLLLVGGMILGPVVQQYAFGELWTGVPFGWDLTDNKTLIAFVAYIIAVVGNLKKERPYLTVIAAFAVLVIFSIPHSMFGSEFNYETGTIQQAMMVLNK